MFELLELKQNNSELLDLLTKNLPDMLWVKDIDGNYLYVNKAICTGLLMAKDTDEPLGKSDIFFALREREAHSDKPDWHTFGELCFNSDKVVIDDNKAIKFEEYGNVKGKLLYLEVFKAPFYDKDGNIMGTVGSGRDITKLKKNINDLEVSLKALERQNISREYRANHDKLTGLVNRTLFLDRLSQITKRTNKFTNKVALVLLKLDNLKDIYDSLGKYAHDKILLDLSKLIQSKLKVSDTLAQLNTCEYCIIIDDDLSIIKGLVDDINNIKKSFIANENKINLDINIGISIYPDDGKDADTLLKKSYSALYISKHNPLSEHTFFNEYSSL